MAIRNEDKIKYNINNSKKNFWFIGTVVMCFTYSVKLLLAGSAEVSIYRLSRLVGHTQFVTTVVTVWYEDFCE